MAPKPTTQQINVEPPKGWDVQSVYGTLKDARGHRLVRLEDVHAWLMTSKELASANAAARIFSAFISDTGSSVGLVHGAAAVRKTLCFLDPSENAAAYDDYSGREFIKKLAALFPYVPHAHFERGTVEALIYSVGIVAGYLWAPAMRDNREVDLNASLESYGADGAFPSCSTCRDVLGRFAVSLNVAHALWGWGNSAEVVQLHVVGNSAGAPGANAGPSASASEAVSDVRKRVPKTSWTPEQEQQLSQDFKDAIGKQATAKYAAVAKLWGIGEGSVKKQLAAIKKRNESVGALGSMATNLVGTK